MQNYNNDTYLNLRELSQYSTFSLGSLRAYLKDPDSPIPHYRVKRKILVRKSEFDRWMEQFRCDATELDRIVDEVMHELQ